jgi:hypothetical protein
MKNLLLSVALIVSPVLVFAAAYTMIAPTPSAQLSGPPSVSTFGDMKIFQAITTDVQTFALKGDLSAAQKRITDLETAWDDAQSALRPVNTFYWGYVDGAIDDALKSLRAKPPDPAHVDATLLTLQAAFADPSIGGAAQDATARAVPCEVMLDKFRAARSGATLTDAQRTILDGLQAKGTERCNADDDTRAGDFFAQGIALMSQ